MAEATPKRELPARERRQSFKLQESSPKVAPKVAEKPAPLISSPASSDAIPRVKRKYTRRVPLLHKSTGRRNSTPVSEDLTAPRPLVSSRPLPTTSKKPESNLSLKQYHSIAESAILATSLYRSRVQWLCDGIFQRYWTKPSKKKGAAEAATNNPDQKSMHKLGLCQITIEPHVFSATIYTVRETRIPPPPFYRPPYPYPPNPQISQQPSFPSSPTPPQQQLQNKLCQQSQDPNGSSADQQSVKKEPSAESEPASGPPSTSASNAHPPTPAPVSRSSQTPSTPQKPNADPVIQMLAARAAADPHLKELMKVVATSKATADQLKEFQGHIDEFNAIIKKGQEQQKSHPQALSSSSPPKKTAQLSNSAENSTPLGGRSPSNAPSLSAAHPSTYNSPLVRGASHSVSKGGPPGPPGSTPHYAYYPPPPPPRPEAFVKHIVFEITSPASGSLTASQDRWLFPEYAVLDTPPSGRGLEMVCSFFVERKGSQILNAQSMLVSDVTTPKQEKWKANVEYFQPVTMLLHAPQHRTLETIARAAKPLPEVQAYMVDVMKNKTRAPVEYLTLQLPREGVDEDVPMADFEDSAIEMSESDELKDFYGN